jgi:hypothetical protein
VGRKTDTGGAECILLAIQETGLIPGRPKKTDLIELLYALDAAGCFNLGRASLNRIAAYFEEVFHTDLSHFPRDFYEMRTRNDRMPFTDKLKNLLKKRMDDPKKPYNKE